MSDIINLNLSELVSNIKVGDKVVIIGNRTGIKKLKIKTLEIKNKPVKQGKKTQEIAIKVLSKVRKNDQVYVIKSSH